MKTVQIRSYFWAVLSCIQSKYRKIRIRNNLVFGHFLRSGTYLLLFLNIPYSYSRTQTPYLLYQQFCKCHFDWPCVKITLLQFKRKSLLRAHEILTTPTSTQMLCLIIHCCYLVVWSKVDQMFKLDKSSLSSLFLLV